MEELPDGYSDGNLQEAVLLLKQKNSKTYLCKEFTLVPLKTTSVEIKNNRQAIIKLQKETWSFGNQWASGWINTGNSNAGYQF